MVASDRSRAATSAHRAELEAESWITPPPAPSLRNRRGSPHSSTSQSITRVSSSVQAGLEAHSIPCTPRPDDSRSPRIDGPVAGEGKKAKNPGACQWVRPGTMTRSRSSSTASNPSGAAGGDCGSPAAISPGCTRDRTGKLSICS